MVKSDDSAVKFLAKEINDEGLPQPHARIIHDPNLEQARYQDARTQGKDFYISCPCRTYVCRPVTQKSVRLDGYWQKNLPKLVPLDHFCCQNWSGQTKFGSQNWFPLATFGLPCGM